MFAVTIEVLSAAAMNRAFGASIRYAVGSEPAPPPFQNGDHCGVPPTGVYWQPSKTPAIFAVVPFEACSILPVVVLRMTGSPRKILVVLAEAIKPVAIW